MKRVVVFGTFDPLHAGHLDFFAQARGLGDHLLVIVACDSWIRDVKQREPRQGEADRLAAVQAESGVDAVRLGDQWPTTDQYRLLGEIDVDILALGYDQEPSNQVVQHELSARGKSDVEVVRLQPYRPDVYKSSYV